MFYTIVKHDFVKVETGEEVAGKSQLNQKDVQAKRTPEFIKITKQMKQKEMEKVMLVKGLPPTPSNDPKTTAEQATKDRIETLVREIRELRIKKAAMIQESSSASYYAVRRVINHNGG